MKAKGIRILDKEGHFVLIKLADILKEISDGNQLHWSILFLDAIGDLGNDRSIVDLAKQANESERGIFLPWNELNDLAEKIYIIDIDIIGCRDERALHRYSNDKVMYEACDCVIEMFDSSYWEIVSKDQVLISSLAAKFKDTELLEYN